MPLRGAGHSVRVGDDTPFFESLAQLDLWSARAHEKLSGVLTYQPRPTNTKDESDSRGKLLVCHDYKGGYTEIPSARSYTFNFWSFCDTFVYFSHHRVTVPPSGWTNAAHRQGVKMLGTLIFEGSGEADCLQLIVGGAQRAGLGPITSTGTLPISQHYATVLAELAYQRGFDGYLLNFECPLGGGFEQARALTAWILVLRAELRSKVGPHAQVVWYDSVTIDGKLRWQDRLNNYNLPFFLASDAFFTNYTWPPEYPSLTAQYFMTLDPALVSDASLGTTSLSKAKSLQSIFTGVDVWGRNQYGGGGFNSYRAISHIAPQSLGLSVALFGQAWTWESEQDKQGWNWDQWWDYERKLWIGPPQPGDVVLVPDPPKQKPGSTPYDEGPFQPMSTFFVDAPPPDPARFTFYTSFCPGVGNTWFVNGTKVLQTETGWADIDKQCSLGNLLWPRPKLVWEGDERVDSVPTASSAIDMNDGWNGGNTLELTIACDGSTAEDAFFRCIWLPIQSLSVTAQKSYDLRIVYKATSEVGVDLDLGVTVKSQSSELDVGQAIMSDLSESWTQQTLQFTVLSSSGSSSSIAIGLVVGFAAEDPSEACKFSISLGQLAVYPSAPPSTVSVANPAVLWAKFEPVAGPASGLAGVLTWATASSFPPLTDIPIFSPESPDPAWILDDTPTYRFPSFVYFNIYVTPYSRDQVRALDPSAAVFVGTTGLDGRANRFYVEPQCLPGEVVGSEVVRFYVQGVTDRGEVLPWARCACVDYVVGSVEGN